MNNGQNGPITCCGQVNHGSWCQETYESASRQAGRRARQLRQLGYRVSVSTLGPQVTRYGVVKMTLVDVRPGSAQADTFDLPAVRIVR